MALYLVPDTSLLFRGSAIHFSLTDGGCVIVDTHLISLVSLQIVPLLSGLKASGGGGCE